MVIVHNRGSGEMPENRQLFVNLTNNNMYQVKKSGLNQNKRGKVKDPDIADFARRFEEKKYDKIDPKETYKYNYKKSKFEKIDQNLLEVEQRIRSMQFLN